MAEQSNKKYFEILEISPDASLSEIKNAYLRLKKLYAADSVVISPVINEFPKRNRKEILRNIEKAYTELVALLQDEQNRSISQRRSITPGIPDEKGMEDISYSGDALRQIREKMGIQLYEVALETKIRIELLQNIEFEKFDALPTGIYLKAHLMNYANFLSLNAKKVAEDYISRYEEWKRESGKKVNT